MTKEFDLVGRNAPNLIGAIGEIVAWDALYKMGIRAFKIGSWNFFPRGYPYWRGELNDEHRFLTREQAEFVEHMRECDFIGVKLKHGLPWVVEVENPDDFMAGKTRGKPPSVEKVEDVYLIEVKTGIPRTVRFYAKNPTKAFAFGIEKAKEIGFKVLLVIVELLDNWKCRISYREL